MLNNKSYICWIITTLVLVSCEKGIGTSMLWGKTDYYTDFMFYEYEPVRMTRTICFDANEDSEGRVGNVKFSLYKMSNDSTYVPVKDDILLYKDDDDGTEEYLLVYYDEFQASFLLKSNESQYPIEMYNTDLYEVVGNQFDNPELLDKFSLWGYGNGK